MSHGKDVCGHLKEVRRRIAEENGIPLEPKECGFEGECDGTCPYCEAEVRYLERALAERVRLGKVATVAGLALGLATTALQAQAEEPEMKPAEGKEIAIGVDRVTVRGVVRDSVTGEPIPFCRVYFVARSIVLDTVLEESMDGSFALKVPKGEYNVFVTHPGYVEYTRRNMEIEGDLDLGEIRLARSETDVMMYILGTSPREGIKEYKRPGQEEYEQEPGKTTITIR